MWCIARSETFRMFLTFPPDLESRLRFRNYFLNPDLRTNLFYKSALPLVPNSCIPPSMLVPKQLSFQKVIHKRSRNHCFKVSCFGKTILWDFHFEVGMCSQGNQMNVLFVLSLGQLRFQKNVNRRSHNHALKLFIFQSTMLKRCRMSFGVGTSLCFECYRVDGWQRWFY